VGAALAAFAGALTGPLFSVESGMGDSILIMALVVIVIGGIGSVWGALLAALLIGFTDTFGKVLFPDYAGMSVYVLMAAILLWRPAGLFGRA
jgi:branched-chain amino acid transport system permease protein